MNDYVPLDPRESITSSITRLVFIPRILTTPEDLQEDARPTTLLDGMTADVQHENAERSSRI